MKIKNILFLSLLVFSFLIFNKSFALEIKEIIYNPEGADGGKEWFEICNTGESIIGFTDNYKIITPQTNKESSKPYSEHDLSPEYSTGGKDFPEDNCAAITQDAALFKEYNSNYNHLIFDSSWTDLNNTGGFVGILKDKLIVKCKAYGTGSCPEVSNDNASSETSSSDTSSSTSATSTSTSPSTSVKEKIVYVYVAQNNQDKYGDIQILLPEEKIVLALAETEYTVKAIDSNKKVISNLNFHWSFGDGGEKFGKDALYTYTYPGEYILIASADGFISGGKARMNVRVVEPNIVISEIGNEKNENIIILKNNTDSDLFLSNFYLNLDNNFYKLPRNLMLAKNKTLKLSGEALGFKLPANNISLHYPNKNILVSFKKEEEKELDFSSTSIISAVNIPSFLENSEEKSLRNKESLTFFGEIREISKTEKSIKNSNSKFIVEENKANYLRKLVLDAEFKDKNTIFNKEKVKNIKMETDEKSKNVDTKIVDWFKSLIY